MSGSTSQTVFFKPQRSIGTIIPDCTIEERHQDRMEVTRHPVEQGAMISDHAFQLPYEVSARYGWSDSSTGEEGGSQQIYEQLQALQRGRQPFQLVTGKRIYQNMLLTEIEVTSDQHTENILMVEAHCQEILTATTSSVQSDPANQAQASKTQDVTSAGPQQLRQVSSKPTISGFSDTLQTGSQVTRPLV